MNDLCINFDRLSSADWEENKPEPTCVDCGRVMQIVGTNEDEQPNSNLIGGNY